MFVNRSDEKMFVNRSDEKMFVNRSDEKMFEKIKNISKENVKGKTLILRVDFNTSVKHGHIIRTPKLLEHMKTARILCEKGAKIIMLSHQGRKGHEDFVSLEMHLSTLKELCFDSIKNIYFSKWDEDYLKKIDSLQSSEVLLMENTRFLDFEINERTPKEHSENPVIKALAKKADYFVLDSLSIAHRSQATVVGFTELLPSFAGIFLEKELRALGKIDALNGEMCLVLGGSKPKEPLEIIKKMLEENKVKHVLLGGILGELGLKAKGLSLGKKDEYLKEKGLDLFIPEFKELLKFYGDKIHLPVDVAIEKRAKRREIPITDLPTEFQIFDVGHHTIHNYADIITACNLIVFNGPFGVYEKSVFRTGTREMLEEIIESKGFSLLGGGDTVSSLVALGFRNEDFGHVSLAGGALLSFLSGKELPGLTALKR